MDYTRQWSGKVKKKLGAEGKGADKESLRQEFNVLFWTATLIMT